MDFFLPPGNWIMKVSKNDLFLAFFNIIELLFSDEVSVVVEYYHYHIEKYEVTPR